MCGTIGFVDKTNRLSGVEKERLIKKMIVAIEHRGRDHTGYFIDGETALGNVRLSIIDTSDRGDQPFFDVNKKVVVSYNGEIYNYRDVNEVISKRYMLSSSCDTETLVYSYLNNPHSFLEPLHGMFAFSLLDRTKKKLILGVDRFAIKPLYYIDTDEWFAWSSEIKALIGLPGFTPELDGDALSEQVLFRHVAGERTLLKSVKRVLPGEMIVYDKKNNRAKRKKYYELTAHRIDAKNDRSKLRDLLVRSVEEHLLADVPVGLQLSGGVDSSLVASIASKNKNGLHTYSIGLKDKRWNEFHYSREVAQKCKTRHTEMLFTEADFAKLLPELTYMLDEPLGHSHAIPMHMLAKRARKDVKVLLSGEGADETFLGYRRYPVLLNAKKLDDETLMFSNAFSCVETAASVVAHFDASKKSLSFRSKAIADTKRERADRRVTKYDLQTYLIPLLIRQDKMGMAANLENRVPFLDHRLVEFGYSVPRERKVAAESKIILKEVAEEYFSHEFAHRPKVGFGQPIAQWLCNPKGLGRYLKLFKKGAAPKYLQYDRIRVLADEHAAKKADHSVILWTLITLEIWMRIFLKKQKPEAILKSIT